MKTARAAVEVAKVALGKRGQIWWDHGAPELNRHVVENTPYAVWYRQLQTTAKGCLLSTIAAPISDSDLQEAAGPVVSRAD